MPRRLNLLLSRTQTGFVSFDVVLHHLTTGFLKFHLAPTYFPFPWLFRVAEGNCHGGGTEVLIWGDSDLSFYVSDLVMTCRFLSVRMGVKRVVLIYFLIVVTSH